ncbi:MAG: MBL fold metallo-hydrolase [Devosia sp.]
MPQSLANAGIAQQAVDTILISHFHPDHIFGLMAPETDAQLFPSAEIVVLAEEYAFWTDPGVFSRLPNAWHGLPERIQRTLPNWSNVRTVAGFVELAPGINTLPAPGHTVGHMAYHVSSGDRELIIAGDVALSPALFVAHPDWKIAYDALPDVAARMRRRILDQAGTDDVLVAGYHFGFPNVGHIERDGAGFSLTHLCNKLGFHYPAERCHAPQIE